MKKQKSKGFTIVELVIVIAVIAILAAVLIPTFSSLIDRANESADVSTARNIMTMTASNEERVSEILKNCPEQYEEKFEGLTEEPEKRAMAICLMLIENGLNPAAMTAKAKNAGYVYDATNDQLVYYREEDGRYRVVCAMKNPNIDLSDETLETVIIITDNADFENKNIWDFTYNIVLAF